MFLLYRKSPEIIKRQKETQHKSPDLSYHVTVTPPLLLKWKDYQEKTVVIRADRGHHGESWRGSEGLEFGHLGSIEAHGYAGGASGVTHLPQHPAPFLLVVLVPNTGKRKIQWWGTNQDVVDCLYSTTDQVGPSFFFSSFSFNFICYRTLI